MHKIYICTSLLRQDRYHEGVPPAVLFLHELETSEISSWAYRIKSTKLTWLGKIISDKWKIRIYKHSNTIESSSLPSRQRSSERVASRKSAIYRAHAAHKQAGLNICNISSRRWMVKKNTRKRINSNSIRSLQMAKWKTTLIAYNYSSN